MLRAKLILVGTLGLALATGWGPRLSAEAPDALYNDGVKFYEAKDYKAAVDKLKQFAVQAKNDPRLPEAKQKLGESLIGMGMLMQASATFEEWLRDYATAKTAPQVRLQYAKCFEAVGEWHKAIAEYKEYLRVNPSDPDLRLHIAGIYRDVLAEPKDAIRELEDIQKKHPDYEKKLELKLQLAELHRRQQGGVAQARNAYIEIAKEFPKRPEAQRALQLAAWLSEDGGLKDYAAAMSAYREYVKLFPNADDLYRVYVRMGKLSSDKLDQSANAVLWFNKALALKPNAGVLWDRCLALSRTSDREGVVKSFNELIQKYPDSSQAIEAYNVLWKRQHEWGQTAEAAKILNQAVAQYPKYLPFGYELGHLYREMSKWDEAIAAYSKVAGLEPGYNKGEVYDRLVDCYLSKKDFAGAEKLLKDVLEKFKQNSELQVNCLWNLATRVYEPQNKLDEAIAAYRQVLTDHPGHSYSQPENATARLFAAYDKKKDVAQAIVDIDEIAKKHPDDSNVRLAQAEIVNRLKAFKQYDKAIQYANKILLNDDTDAAAALATVYTAESYAGLGKTREELITYTKLNRFLQNPRASAAHGQLQLLKNGRLQDKRDDALYQRIDLKQWAMKEFKEAKVEKLTTFGDHAGDAEWLLGKVDGWPTVAAGKDLGTQAEFVALVAQIDASAAGLGLAKDGAEKESVDQGIIGAAAQYILKFGSVGGECFVYAEGKLLGKNSKPGAFQYKFEGKNNQGKVTVALLIRGGSSRGTGLLKPAVALSPRPGTTENLLLFGLGYQLAGAHSDALNHYNQFLKKVQDEGQRELVKMLQNRIYAEKGDLEALASNAPAKASLEYQVMIAELYQRDGKRDRAVQAYEKAAQEFVDSRGAAVSLARAYEANGKHAEAVRTWLDILDRWPNLGNVESYRRYVVWYAANRARNISQARDLARTFAQPPTHYWLRTLGDLFYTQRPQDYAQAVTFYYQAYKAADADNWYEAGRVFDSYVADKQIPTAIRFAEVWSKENPGHSQTPLMVYKIGRAYQDAGNHPKALEYYRTVQDEYPFSEAATSAVLDAIDLPGQDSLGMLDKWVKANQGNPKAAEMYWALSQKHEAQKASDKALPLYEKIWSEFPAKEPENFRSACRIATIRFGSEDAATKAKGVTMMEQIVEKFGARGEPEIRRIWSALGGHYRASDAQKYIAHNMRVANTFRGQPGALDAQMSIMSYLMEQHKHLEAAIHMQRLINGMPARNTAWWDRIVDVGLARLKDKRFGEAAVVFKSLLRKNEGFNAAKSRDVANYMADALSKSGAVVANVGADLPEAGILWGNIFANAGEPELAWTKYSDNEELFGKYHHLATPAFIQVIVNRLLDDKKIREAINICRRFMITHAHSTHLEDADKAKVQLLLGDAYFRDERFEIARDEFTTVITMWGNTREAVDAQFRVGETLMAQKIYAKAEEIFTDLSTYRDQEISAKAHLMLGVLYHTMDDLERAEEKFKEVLAMAPKNETADMIMYRLGMVYQVSKKYREALDTLRLIGAYSGESKRVVSPGSDLRIRLSDRNLQIVKGSTSVPILIQTASGDEETIQLSRSFAGPGLFVASIQTELGRPNPGDKKLQVVGGDVITYDYHPDFKQDVVVQEMAEKLTITIADDAELKLSATEIKDDEEVEIDPSLFARREEGREEFRAGDELAPGNVCYVQVKDGDHDVDGEKNNCTVTMEATSGDSVRISLTEVEEHGGKFRGSVQTALKPPDAVASDSAEGHEPRFAIDENPSAESAWIGQMDGRAPKWLMIDLKDLKTVDKIEWSRGTGFKEGEERKLVRYAIDVARKKDEWFPIVAQPKESAPLRSIKLLDNTDAQPVDPLVMRMRRTNLPFISDGDPRTAWRGRVKTDPKSTWTVDLDLGQVCTLDRFVLRDGSAQNAVKAFKIYTEEKPGLKPVADKGWALLHIPPNSPKNITLMTSPRARYLRLVVTATTGDHPEIGDLDIIPKLDFNVAKAAAGLGSTFTFQPVEARFIRVTINEFLGDAPAIGHLAIHGGEAQHIPVPGVDVHALATNDILEVSPGDTVTASYNDEVNVDPGSPKVYRESLHATYYNGDVACIRNEWIEDSRGNRRKEELTVARIDVNQKDQRIVIKITEYDADQTDGIDKLAFTVLSRSTGAKLDLAATETGPFDGEFTKEVDITMAGQTDPAQAVLKVVDGDVLDISYEDELNTDPGNRTRRSFELSETLPTAGSIEVVSDLGVIAAEKADEKPVVLVSIEDSLRIQVTDPDRALDSGSKVIVDLETVPGGDTARVECEIDELDGGIFAGSIKLALGDKDSPDEIVEAAGFGGEFSDASGSSRKKKKEELPTVPVLNVMGRDIIVARYVDETSPDAQGKVERIGKARIITDGVVGFHDDEYEEDVKLVHLGDKIYLKVEDGDADVGEERDQIEVFLTSTLGDRLVLPLTETLSHSGIFTSAVDLIAATKADQNNQTFEADFGDEIKVVYSDQRNLDRDESGAAVGAAERDASVRVVVGTDGELTAFGKKYPNDEIAIETQFHIGECYYYLGKDHIELKSEKLGLLELKEGQEILRDLMVHFPGSKSVDQAAYLLANLAQEQKKFYEAIEVYERVTLDWPKSIIAPDAQYKMGICYERMDDMDKAMEEYVRLAYKFPESALVGDAMIRIGLYFFNKKNYGVAVQVFGKFVEKYPDHLQVQKVAFKMGLCHILAEQYADAGDHFRDFVEMYADSALKPAALYWAGDAYLKANNALKSYQMFKRCIWDYSETKWAKFARGRLTAPIFDRIAEME